MEEAISIDVEVQRERLLRRSILRCVFRIYFCRACLIQIPRNIRGCCIETPAHPSVALTRSQDRPAARRAPASCKSGGEVSGGDESPLLEERDPRSPHPAAPCPARPAPRQRVAPTGRARPSRAARHAPRAQLPAPRRRVSSAGGARPSYPAPRATLCPAPLGQCPARHIAPRPAPRAIRIFFLESSGRARRAAAAASAPGSGTR